jgi:hypothetical protein
MTPQEESAAFEKFRSAVNWAQEQAGFPTFVVACGYFEPAGRFYASHMGMTATSTDKGEISMQPLLAATFTAAVRAQTERFVREIVRTLVESTRAAGGSDEEIAKLCGDFEKAFRERIGVEETNFLNAWDK